MFDSDLVQLFRPENGVENKTLFEQNPATN